ncbi:MAG: Kelch repeat-containing protein [Acidobacteriota bacterium]
MKACTRVEQIVAAGVGVLALAAAALAAEPAAISLERRVAAQRAIEEVYWRHREWPEQNPGPKPALSAVLGERVIRERAEDGVRASVALERLWRRPITPAQLQAEIDRLGRETRRPEVLAELFAALGDDPTTIAECLARPLLAGRLLRAFYGRDERVHGALRSKAEGERRAVKAVADLRGLSGRYEEIEWAREVRTPESKLPVTSDGVRRIELGDGEWAAKLDELGRVFGVEGGEIPVGAVSGVIEEDGRFVVHGVQAREGVRVRVASVSWEKEAYASWWRRVRGEMTGEVEARAAYRMPVLQVSCADDTWTPIPEGLPGARYDHTAVWTGSEMIVWGGVPATNTGVRYDPATDSWAVTTILGAPSRRERHSAVWTGTLMIVWGGKAAGSMNKLADGGRYDPTMDSWSPTTLANAPEGRTAHTAVWTGSEMIVWGGSNTNLQYLSTGGRYNPVSDTWVPTAMTAGVPSPRDRAGAVWTGSKMIVWGGFPDRQTGGVYDPVSDAWTPTSTTNAPTYRIRHSSVWTGTQMVVWGGWGCADPPACTTYGYLDTGGRYDPATDAWSPTATTGAPSPRVYHSGVWTGGELIVWGGSPAVDTGGRYDPLADTWTSTATAGAPSARAYHTSVWTGTEMVVWGGFDPLWGAQQSGGRYSPSADSWVPTKYDYSPYPRSSPRAFWTGAEFLVWGGNSYFGGGIYDPATALWRPVNAVGAPNVTDPDVVWTGTELIAYDAWWSQSGGRYDLASDTWTTMTASAELGERGATAFAWSGSDLIVWGGVEANTYDDLDSGALYSPASDSWRPMSMIGAPAARRAARGVWASGAFVVWGGYQANPVGPPTYFASGGRYDPITNAWLPLSTGGAPAGRREHTALWTGSEMVVWGGEDYSGYLDSGGVYNLPTDTWRQMSLANAPAGRTHHGSVFTGAEMLVWGGSDAVGERGDGARYVVSTDTWMPLQAAGSPSPRADFGAAWAGTEMIVWGGSKQFSTGYDGLGDGGRYCATPRPYLQVAPDPLDFGRVVVGRTSARTLTVSNRGSAPLVIFTVSPASAPFVKTADACTGQTLASGQSCSVTVAVTPVAIGALSGSLTVASADPGTPVRGVTLHAEAVDVLLVPLALVVDDASGNGSGVLEPSESAGLVPSWRNDGIATAASLSGTLTASGGVLVTDGAAAYGDVAPGAEAECAGDCHAVTAASTRPQLHWDVPVHEVLSSGDAHDWVLHLGASFDDVLPGAFAYSFIETILHHGITAGCGGAQYCPAQTLTRWQMAVFESRALAGGDDGAVPTSGTVPGMGDYDCRSGGVSVFLDVAPEDGGCPYIHDLAARGVTAGCGGGNFCPSSELNRWEAAVFLSIGMTGDAAAIPVSGTVPGVGDYDCVAGGVSVFGDVPPEDAGCSFIHYLAAEGVTAGCGGGKYCPADPLRRDQMAVFIAKAFDLTLYGP